ncbi:hypothetical protein KW786_01520 [Candidatus Parcubacteria bacterium]|nr:hypothetical protein [Candidatus Parcubacteria bacterium]
MNKKFVFSAAVTALSLLPVIALAAIDPTTWFSGIIDRLLTLVILPIFSGLIIVMFVYAGFLFLTAQGDPAKISTAKKVIIWAIVGIIVAFLSYTIVNFISSILDPSIGINGAGGGGGFPVP